MWHRPEETLNIVQTKKNPATETTRDRTKF